MAKKGKPPTLPEQLRQLADAIEDVTQPKKPPTTEESLSNASIARLWSAASLADIRKPSFSIT